MGYTQKARRRFFYGNTKRKRGPGYHRGLNTREAHVKKLAIDRGYEVLKCGWPDFLLYKEKENKAVFLEVKAKPGTGGDSNLNEHQKRMMQILKKLGLNWQIIYI